VACLGVDWRNSLAYTSTATLVSDLLDLWGAKNHRNELLLLPEEDLSREAEDTVVGCKRQEPLPASFPSNDIPLPCKDLVSEQFLYAPGEMLPCRFRLSSSAVLPFTDASDSKQLQTAQALFNAFVKLHDWSSSVLVDDDEWQLATEFHRSTTLSLGLHGDNKAWQLAVAALSKPPVGTCELLQCMAPQLFALHRLCYVRATFIHRKFNAFADALASMWLHFVVRADNLLKPLFIHLYRHKLPLCVRTFSDASYKDGQAHAGFLDLCGCVLPFQHTPNCRCQLGRLR
jgi:hypothetical protein